MTNAIKFVNQLTLKEAFDMWELMTIPISEEICKAKKMDKNEFEILLFEKRYKYLRRL